MIKYSESYVRALARGLSEPGEELVAAGAGNYQSFWTFGIPLFRHAYLLLATTARLILVDHRKGLIFDRMDAVRSLRWSDIGSIKLGGLPWAKKLVIKDTANRTLLKLRVPPFLVNPIANNVPSLRNIVQTWEQRRALAAQAPAFGALPAHAYAQPGMVLQAPQGSPQVLS